MKVTALLPDKLMADVRALADGRNTTDSLVIALQDWTRLQKIRRLASSVRKRPLAFARGYSARRVRSLTRSK
jgi:hypothetical protein